MAQSSLGKDSGYSRLGADLLFEYNKAVMKNSARLSMLQLAGLIDVYKRQPHGWRSVHTAG